MTDLSRFYQDIQEILANARQKAYSAINTAMVEAYWHIGKRIIEEEQQGKTRADYGDYLITELSKALTRKLGKGFSIIIGNLQSFFRFKIPAGTPHRRGVGCRTGAGEMAV